MTTGIAAIGECMIELSDQNGPNWRLGFAGDTLNTLWTIRALTDPSVPTSYVSAFGDDPFSRDQIAFLAATGIGTASSPIIPGLRPGLYAITLDGAERSFTYWRSDSAARQLASEPAALAASIAGADLVYFSGITLAILDSPGREILLEAIGAARNAGTRIAFDPNYRPRLWPSKPQAQAAIGNALAVTDIALPTFPDEHALFGDASSEATAARLAAAGVGEIVVKDGDKPAFVSVDGKQTTVPAVHVANPVDTTGAGDSFNGSYLAARLLGIEPAEAVQRAHRVAAAVVQVKGALAPVETLRAAFGETR